MLTSSRDYRYFLFKSLGKIEFKVELKIRCFPPLWADIDNIMVTNDMNLAEILNHRGDMIIDVRSPAEYAEDHVAGAVNLPVLNNEERARVGTIYVQDSPFKARKLGAALVFRNAATHIEQHLSGFEGSWRPLVYCWRGGQRSSSFAWMLQQIGWRAEVLPGGYQTYRRLVSRALYDDVLPFKLYALDGYTGTAKTAILQEVAALGGQVLDLETLARHRGSLLGACAEPQPSQKAFESAIAAALAGFDTDKPLLVEAEASKIGARSVPPSLWSAMCKAPRIDVTASVAARVDYLCAAYDDILSDHARLEDKLGVLRAHRSNAVVDQWLALSLAGNKRALTRALIEEHYDPTYQKARVRYGHVAVAQVSLSAFAERDLKCAAEQVMRILMEQVRSA